MAFKTRRQERYLTLRNSGFLKFEANALSKVSLDVPYFRSLITERRRMAKEAKDTGMSVKKWESQIKQYYIYNDFYSPATEKKRAKLDPWAMLRHWEDEFKDKNPDYQSPWIKRQKRYRDFLRKAENTLKLQKGIPLKQLPIEEPAQGELK